MKRTLLWITVCVAGMALLVAVSVAAVTSAVNSSLIREQQTANTNTLDNTDRTLRLVEDCTSPGGECYERGQKATADAVGDIGRVTVLAAACAVSLDERLDVPARANQIQRCIVDQLAQEAP